VRGCIEQRDAHRKKRAIEYAESEFQAMLEEIEANMAAQLAQLREMEWGGEVVAIPRDGA